MFGIYWWKITKALIASLITGVLVLSLVSCGELRTPASGDGATTETVSRNASPSKPSGNISEVSPPEVIQTLRQALEIYQPQVAILSPQPDEVLQDSTVKVQLQVQELPIFKNAELDMGPHLHVILDNQPYIAVYDLNEPLVLPDLPPGTHTLRVFASRPWHESFKNEGAYAQTTFHIFTKNQDNNPDSAQPLLTYSRPKGSYGAEPILLDFYLTNAPLHLVAQENPDDDIADWRIRCTINGNSFVLDRWQSIYLKGFKPGNNWVQLEFLDEQGNSVKNVFNNTVRLITYEPKGKDTLSKLVRGELSAESARGIVNPNYTAKIPTVAPTPELTPSPTPTPVPTPTPSPTDLPEAIETPSPQPTAPDVTAPSPENKPEPQPEATTGEETAQQSAGRINLPASASPEVNPAPAVEPEPQQSKPPEKQKFGAFFSRFRRPAATPSPTLSPTLPEIVEPPSSELVPPEAAPQPESSPNPESFLSPTPSKEAIAP